MSIRKSIAINLVGYVTPLLVAVVTIPVLIQLLGVERFGILTIAWGIVGYFSIFDFGMGRAITKCVSEKLAINDLKEAANYSITGFAVLALVAIPILFLLVGFRSSISEIVINASASLSQEVSQTLLYLALSIPLTLVSNGVRGTTEGLGRFDLVNYIRIPQSVLNYIIPVAVAQHSLRVDDVVLALVLSRLVFLMLATLLMVRAYPLFLKGRFSNIAARHLITYGGWLSVSNFLAPLMLYADRFFISTFVGASVLAYYTTPFEMVTKMWVVPGAIIGVLFPKFVGYFASNPGKAKDVYRKGLFLVACAMLPAVAAILVFGDVLIELWINKAFALESGANLKILAVGVLVNSFAQVSASFIQANGRPDITAKVNLIEIAPYALYLTVLCGEYGVLGAAIAWSCRAAINASLLLVISEKVILRETREKI